MHIGKNLALCTSGYHHAENVSDTQLAEIYRNSAFVAGMRMIEGFELPIIEGAACGCRPITLDLECYRRWFNPFAAFVDPNHLDDDLQVLSNLGWMQIPQKLIERFTWTNVMKEFWNNVLILEKL